MEWIVQSENEFVEVARQLLLKANSRRKFTLTGDLGAGKTAMVKACCKVLGVKEPATSPSFSIVNQYVSIDGKGKESLIHHLDLYRLKSVEEALDIGIEDYLFDENFCFIEWPEIAESLLPEDIIRIKLSIVSRSSRKIILL